jgi:hypothetical protein
LRNHPVRALTPSSAPEGFGNCVIRGIEHSEACVHRSSFVDVAMIVIQPSMQRMCTATRLTS